MLVLISGQGKEIFYVNGSFEFVYLEEFSENYELTDDVSL